MRTRGGRERPGRVALSKWEEGVDERERERTCAQRGCTIKERERKRRRERKRENA